MDKKKVVTHESGPYTIVKGKTLYMAKLLARAGDDETVIYLDGDPMNNQKENFKVVKTEDLE